MPLGYDCPISGLRDIDLVPATLTDKMGCANDTLPRRAWTIHP